MPAPGAAAATRDEPVTAQEVVDGARRGQGLLRPLALEVPPDLLGAVERMAAAQGNHGLDDGLRRRMRAGMRAAGAIGQAGWPCRLPALEPLVRSLATDVEAPAQL